MATRTAQLDIKVAGENDYKQAISAINRENQNLSAEMKKLAEQYKGSEDSMEAMRAKSDLLQRQLDQQKEKVKTLREALERAKNEYGEADRRTDSWRKQLLNAERDEIKLERAVEESTKALAKQEDQTEESGQKLVTLGDQVEGLADTFGIRIPDGVKKALDNVDGFSTGTVAAMGAAVAGIAAVELAIKAVTAGIDAARKLNEITLEQAEKADALLTRSAQTGLSTDLLQQLDYASKFLDFDGIDQSLVKLTASMDKARDGAENQAAAFKTLGISVTDTDGQLRDNWEVFMQTIDALGQIENATERDALANDLFGKSYAELKPLIDAGSEGLQEFMDAAVETGSVLTEDQIRVLGEVDDAHQRYQQQIENTKNMLAVEFAPVSERVMTAFGGFFTEASQKLVDSGIIDKLGKFLEPLETVLDVLLELMDAVLPVLNPLVDALATAFSAVADALERAVTWFRELPDKWLEDRGSRIYDSDSNAYNASGTESWRGGMTWVGESGPELVSLPQGTRIWSNQESDRIAAAGTDTSRMEALLERNVSLLSAIYGSLANQRMLARM